MSEFMIGPLVRNRYRTRWTQRFTVENQSGIQTARIAEGGQDSYVVSIGCSSLLRLFGDRPSAFLWTVMELHRPGIRVVR